MEVIKICVFVLESQNFNKELQILLIKKNHLEEFQ